jgi:hypothetical protein
MLGDVVSTTFEELLLEDEELLLEDLLEDWLEDLLEDWLEFELAWLLLTEELVLLLVVAIAELVELIDWVGALGVATGTDFTVDQLLTPSPALMP